MVTMKYNIWIFIFDSFDLFYKLTGFRLQSPIEVFFPNFCPWLFGKVIGKEGVKLND